MQSETETGIYTYDRDGKVIMEAISEAYSNADHWSTKRQLLSIVAADFPFQMIKEYVPDLTLWKFNESRRQAKLNGLTNAVFEIYR